MATFDQLSAEQRAIIELVLRQGKSYAELADLLDMPEERVRERARASLSELSPVTAEAVDAEWRDHLADYILGQQNGPDATATRGHLRRSEPARAWTRSLLDSLEQLYPNGLPEVPRGGRTPVTGPGGAGEGSVVQRRRLAAIGGAIGLLAIVVALVLVLSGGDDGDDGAGEPVASNTTTTGAGAQAAKPAGVAVVALQDGKYRLVLQATNLPPLEQRQAYEVWLYNAAGDAKSLGAQVLDQNGGFQGQSQDLPRAELERYRFVDVSLEPVNDDTAHSGESVLRGRLSRVREASPEAGQAALVSRAVLRPPAG